MVSQKHHPLCSWSERYKQAFMSRLHTGVGRLILFILDNIQKKRPVISTRFLKNKNHRWSRA